MYPYLTYKDAIKRLDNLLTQVPTNQEQINEENEKEDGTEKYSNYQ